jgi:hypothetical protein
MAVEDVLDFVSHYLDQDPCVSEENWCANCFMLKDYLKMFTAKLKSAQLIVHIFYEYRMNADNPKDHNNL